MFLTPMTLQTISRLRSPSESVPLGESLLYQEALRFIENDGFESVTVPASEDDKLGLILRWQDPEAPSAVHVDIAENLRKGSLRFACSHCQVGGRSASSCAHQWASVVLLWQALTVNPDEFEHPQMKHFSELLNPYRPRPSGERRLVSEKSEYTGVELDSISLILDEAPIFRQSPLAGLLTTDLSKYNPTEASRQQEHFSPRVWTLPEIFRRKLTAYSEHYFHEVNTQNRLIDLIRYNFSNGMQVSLREILRHPLHRNLDSELLPQAKSPASVFHQWPLVQHSGPGFVSHAVVELEEILQALLTRISELHRRKKLDLFLQSRSTSQQALRLQALEYDPLGEVDWRIDFNEKVGLEASFKLVSFRNQELHFFPSFAVNPESGILIIHPWLREFSYVQEQLSQLGVPEIITQRDSPAFEIRGEREAKWMLRALRSRTLPVKVTGGSRTIAANQSRTEIRLNESGDFYIQHEARVAGQKNLVRRGWSSRTQLFLKTLSEGLPYLLRAEAREIASRSAAKRDWDMKLLKHLGILQFLFFEALSVHFKGERTDGGSSKPENLFVHLQDKIKTLLLAGSGGFFVKDTPLKDLCSKGVIACLEDFVQSVFSSLSGSEAFYSEDGEIILEGVVEREHRLIFEMIKSMALQTQGEVFRRSRTPLLPRLSTEPDNPSALFHFPNESAKGQGSSLMHALEALQELVPQGFQIYYKDQILQELQEDEFHVDFLLKAEDDPRLYNWFELNPKFFLRGEEVDPDQLLNLGAGGVIEYAGRLYLVPQKQLPSLKRLEHFWEKLQKGKVDTSKTKKGDKVYQLPRSQTLELLALRSSGVKIRGDAEWKRLCDFYDSLGTQTRELKLPRSMKADLKPYQALGVQWLQDLYQLRLGALLADDMGLGKTLQTLAFLDDLRDRGQMRQALIVVPSSLIFNWQHEVEKFTPEIPLVVFSNKDREKIARRLEGKEPLVVIVTYGLLMEHEDLLTQYSWEVLIFDEAQNLKNITTKRTGAARALNAKFKICLTGTPMENHYGEFYSLVDLLVPGSLGKLDEFRKRFVNTEMITREEIEDLKLKIKPLLLRRTKKEILDQLPEKQETRVSIAFEDRQKEIYRDIALSYNQRVQEAMQTQGNASVQLQMLTALLRLRQACSDPAALPNVRYDKVPPKLETLFDSVKEIVESGESALVFTQFLQTLEHTTKILREAGVPVFVLHGGIPTKQRQKVLMDFQNQPGGGVLVMTLKTGGVGLNLTKASYVFHLEPWWNPSVENQATDRAHRLGQSKAVQVFRYIMHESLEEKIELLKDRKDRKFHALLSANESGKVEETEDLEGDKGPGSGALSKDDFDLLLGLK